MRKLTQSEFLDKCKSIHGDKYDYTKTEYKNTRTKIVIGCKNHGFFEITPDNHLRQKQGCWNCFLDKHKLIRLPVERVENLKKIHNNKYSYTDLSVSKGFINIECPEHGVFNQYLYFHEYGHGCPECNSSSKGEDKIKMILDNSGVEYFRNYCFDDCKRTKKLRFDFYIPDINLIIEYDGEHHFKENKYFGEGNLKYISENDKIKDGYCLEKNINLLRIPYWDFNKIEDIISGYII
jgi:hypothetical protein